MAGIFGKLTTNNDVKAKDESESEESEEEEETINYDPIVKEE